MQIDSPFTRNGRLAQLARASVLHTEGQRFKSSTAHQNTPQTQLLSRFDNSPPDSLTSMPRTKYPTVEEFKDLLRTKKLDWILDRYVLTGLPSCFVDDPSMYNVMMDSIARDLPVARGDIRVVGSARTGFSLAPNKFGQKFNKYSDIDIVVVSQDHFDSSWVDIVTKRRVRWSSLREVTRKNLESHRDSHYVFNGWIYPIGIAEVIGIGRNWFNAFNGLSKIPELSGRQVHGRLYRTWDHAKFYHRRGLSKIKQQLDQSAQEQVTIV